MNSEMIKLFLSSAVPCGFLDSERELKMNVTMTDLLHSMILSVEMKTLIEKVHAERAPFSLVCNLPANFRKSPTVWQFHFLPLFGHDNEYLGTFFHAHEFLFLSPLEYVDGTQPYAVTAEKPSKLFTSKEWQILFFTMQRLSCKEIARRLDIAIGTAESYIKNLYSKIGVHSACQLRALGKSKGLERYIPINMLPHPCVKAVQSVGGAA